MLLGAHRTLVRATREAGQAPSSAKNWERHSIEFLWKWRADAWDNFQLESERQRREVIMHGGLALDVERVEWLRKIGQREADIVSTLQEKIANDPNANRKQLNARYQVMRSSFAETLSALAQETGGRVKRVSVSRDLVDWARQLALEKGYDVEEAARVARLVAGDAQR
jgi:hypothetical protein